MSNEVNFYVSLENNTLKFTYDIYGELIKDIKDINVASALEINKKAIEEVLEKQDELNLHQPVNVLNTEKQKSRIDKETNLFLH